MFEKIKTVLFAQKSIEGVLFWGVLFFVTLAAILSALFTATEEMDSYATYFSILCVVFFIIIAIFAKISHRYSICYFALCLATNVVLLPLLFFFCGGFNSGMVIYCLSGIFIASLHNRRKSQVFLVLVSLLVFELAFALAYLHPELISGVSYKVTVTDIMVSFMLMTVTIYAVSTYLLHVYQSERNKREQLIQKLEFISKHDPLTGIYNRRHFIKRLGEHIWPNRVGYFILMYDIDNFKAINDNYGHPFGDMILCDIANLAKSFTNNSRDEMAIRYGGDEFIQVFQAENMDTALARANTLRESIAKLTFMKHPEISITVSGGIVECADDKFTHQNKMLSFVDGLLFLAKQHGRNQIIARP